MIVSDSQFAPRRFRPSFAILGAIILLCLGVALSIQEDRLFASQKVREISVQADILAASVTAALAFNDKKTAQEYVDALSRNPEIEVAAVYDAGGALVTSFARPGGRAVPRRVQLREAAVEDGRLSIVSPAVQDDEKVGFVYLRAYTESPQRRLARYGGILLLTVMAALLLGVLGLAQSTLTKINRELEDRATALAAANLLLQSEMRERAMAEEALRQSQKMEAIGQLSGGIAHDFNNLMMIVGGNLQLLRRRLAQGRTDVQRYLDAAAEAVTRASTVTQRVLAFSRRQPLSPKGFDLSVLIESMSDLIRHSVGERVRVVKRLQAKSWILCDENQMESVILNLAINARDAMPDGGTLTIATQDIRIDAQSDGFEAVAPGDYVQLKVSDTGTGMSEEVRSKAVDPFFTTKPQGQGTGLGLSMAFGFVRQSNGQMKIESELGKGTDIAIVMPRYVPEQPRTEA